MFSHVGQSRCCWRACTEHSVWHGVWMLMCVGQSGSSFFCGPELAAGIGCISTHSWLQLHIMQCCQQKAGCCAALVGGLSNTDFLVAQDAWLLVPLQ